MYNIKEELEKRLRIKEEEDKKAIRAKEIDCNNYSSKIQIRLTQEEKEVIEGMAKLNRMNMSQFIRYLVFNKYADEILK